MTIKYIDKNISAEFDEIVVTDVELNNGILTFSCKNFYNDNDNQNHDIIIDLKDIKLRIYKLQNGETLNTYKNTQDEAKILKRKTHLFLVPGSQNNSNNTENVYDEYIWSEDKNDFELIGSTSLNLEPINQEISTLKGRMTNAETAITALQSRASTIESNITSLQSNKQDKTDNSLNTTSKTITGAINEINNKIVETVDSVTDGESKAVTSNAVYDYVNSIIGDLEEDMLS